MTLRPKRPSMTMGKPFPYHAKPNIVKVYRNEIIYGNDNLEENKIQQINLKDIKDENDETKTILIDDIGRIVEYDEEEGKLITFDEFGKGIEINRKKIQIIKDENGKKWRLRTEEIINPFRAKYEGDLVHHANPEYMEWIRKYYEPEGETLNEYYKRIGCKTMIQNSSYN